MLAPVSKPSPSSGAQVDQEEVFSFLGDSRTFGLAAPVQRIDTHGAAVFLAGGEVYKVKRAVRFPFMDFSTLEKRRAACEAEIAINKPNAPDIYLGAVPIARTANGLGAPAILSNGPSICGGSMKTRRSTASPNERRCRRTFSSSLRL